MNTEEITKVLDALETGRDAAHEVAQRFHHEMNGHREAEHKQVDEDVSVIEEAINIVKAEYTTSPVSQMTDETIIQIAKRELRSEGNLFEGDADEVAVFVRECLAAAEPQAQAVEPVADPRPLFDRKLSDLQQRGYEVIGRILHKDGEYALFDSSCRWLTKPQYWRLMHEQDGSLFATPPAAQPQPVAEPDNTSAWTALQEIVEYKIADAENVDAFKIKMIAVDAFTGRSASQQAAEPVAWLKAVASCVSSGHATTEAAKHLLMVVESDGLPKFPAIQQPQDELLDAEIDDMCSEAGMQTVFGYHRFIATRQDIRNLLKAALAKKGGAA